MIVEIISTGSELLLGQIINTNAAYMAKELNAIGLDVCYQSTVGDNYTRMEQVFNTALSRADIVITTGGLGPTLGDITKEVSAKIFGRELVIHEPSKKLMEEKFSTRGITYTENNLRQVMAPKEAQVFLNYNGIASGIAMEKEGKTIIHLPGPPREMKDMLKRSVIPYLKEKFDLKGCIESKVLNTIGIGESLLETKLRELFIEQSNPTLALLIRPNGGVLIRITAKGENKQACHKLIVPIEEEIRNIVGDYIYGEDNDDLIDVVSKLLLEKKVTVACGESCTGGMLAAALTSVAGSSNYIKGSIVTYCNEVKSRFLNVSKDTLDKVGAVSPEVAEAMAKGVKELFAANYGIGITGIAGPGGGTKTKPVGLVYIAVAVDNEVMVKKNLFLGSRSEIREATVRQALAMLWENLKNRC